MKSMHNLIPDLEYTQDQDIGVVEEKEQSNTFGIRSGRITRIANRTDDIDLATPQLDFSAQRSSNLLRNLRNVRAAVFHPRDDDGEILVQQLKRIGCSVTRVWPPMKELPDTVDIVFCAMSPDQPNNKCEWMNSEPSLPIIALIDYENPTVLEAAMRMGAVAMIPTPVRPCCILSSMVMAKHLYKERRALTRRVNRLEKKLLSVNQIDLSPGNRSTVNVRFPLRLP